LPISLGAPVPGEILGMAVRVSVAVVLVVLLFVADNVIAGLAIMRSKIVDGGPGPPEAAIKQIGRTRQPGGQFGPHTRLAPPEPAYGVPEPVVPFGKAGWVVSKLVAVRADIPRF